MRRPAFEGPARRRAARVLADDVELFERAGYRKTKQLGPLDLRLERPGKPGVRLRMAQQGRVFGGTYALEISTVDPVVPRSGGLSARGRGIVRLRGIAFRGRRGDEIGRRIAKALERDQALASRLAEVHFEQLRVEPDGRAVIRHMGGSLVWILFPPLIKGVPLVPEQVTAVIGALEAFAEARPE